jgi:hypothetical protein
MPRNVLDALVMRIVLWLCAAGCAAVCVVRVATGHLPLVTGPLTIVFTLLALAWGRVTRDLGGGDRRE